MNFEFLNLKLFKQGLPDYLCLSDRLCVSPRKRRKGTNLIALTEKDRISVERRIKVAQALQGPERKDRLIWG